MQAMTLNGDSSALHPLGIRPLGNQYLADGPKARFSLGTFQHFPDEMLSVLLEYLDQRSLRLLGYTCKFLFAFQADESLWKSLFLSRHASKFEGSWRGSWRSTLLELPPGHETNVDCSGVYSDVLHRPFVCSQIDLSKFASGIPDRNQISRLETLAYDDFAENWAERPFVLTKCIQEWPVYGTWNVDEILKRYGDIEFRAEAVDWRFTTYFEYMTNSKDESPLYLFDKKFAEKMGIKIGRDEPEGAYWRPECFGPDLFEVLGAERPAHRWLIIGSARSGSTYHKDPNGTSAWNAVLQGSKYWMMFPPSASVPGVYVSKDSSEVTSPLSIAEWLLEFHREARQLPECVEGICNAGEILHVPSGWWHLVVNLEGGIALTQNFVPKSHLAEVLSFLRDKPDQVTGFKREITDPYQLFTDRLGISYPEALAEALDVLDKKSSKKRTWSEVVGKEAEEEEEASGGGFSFGFGGGDLDSDVEVP